MKARRSAKLDCVFQRAPPLFVSWLLTGTPYLCWVDVQALPLVAGVQLCYAERLCETCLSPLDQAQDIITTLLLLSFRTMWEIIPLCTFRRPRVFKLGEGTRWQYRGSLYTAAVGWAWGGHRRSVLPCLIYWGKLRFAAVCVSRGKPMCLSGPSTA